VYNPGLPRREAALTHQNRRGQLLRTTLPEAILLLQHEARAAQPIHQGPIALHLQDHHPLPHHPAPDPATHHQVLRAEEVIHQDLQEGAILQVAAAALTQEAHQVAAHHQAAEGKGN